MNNRRLIILDFDRTLFKTDDFARDVKAALLDKHGISLDNEHGTTSNLDPNVLRTAFDLFEHVAAAGIDHDTAASTLREAVAGRDYMQADVADFMSRPHPDTDMVILTVGTDRWQRFKLEHAPLLTHLQHFIVGRNKGAHLADSLHYGDDGGISVDGITAKSYEEIALVDDLPITFEGLVGHPKLQLYRIKRAPFADVPTPDHVHEISSLEEI